MLHPRWYVHNRGSSRFRTDAYGRRAGAGLLQVVSSRVRVDQRRERHGVENAFIAEQPSDGGIYRAGRGLRPAARVRVPGLLRDPHQLTYAACVQLIHPERRPTSPEELASRLRLRDAGAARPPLPRHQHGLEPRRQGHARLAHEGAVDRRSTAQLFHHLRTQADAVMVGAGTAREERYGRMTKNDELRQKRDGRGARAPTPLAVVVSGRLDLPPDLPLLNEPEQRVVIATGVGRRAARA